MKNNVQNIPLKSAEQIPNIFGLRVKLLQNKFKISVMGMMEREEDYLLGANRG